MDKWYASYKKMIKHKDAIFYKDLLKDRAFIMNKVLKSEFKGKNK